MKPEQDDHLEAGGVLDSPREFSFDGLRRPKIVGEVTNPVLEAIRRLWWRAIDCVCGFFVLLRLSIFDRIYGPEPPIPADLQREANHERLVRAFPAMGETIEPRKSQPAKIETAKWELHIANANPQPSFCGSVCPKEAPAFPLFERFKTGQITRYRNRTDHELATLGSKGVVTAARCGG